MNRYALAVISCSPRKVLSAAVLLIGFIALAATLPTGCSSNVTSAVTGGMASANVMLSDPATCQAPSGPFSHVYVTITDVKASVNSSAGDNDSSFVDLTPDLSKSPKQIDLLGQANNQCFLASLGATTQLQAGNYQQIRIFLADNSTTVAGNNCTGAANCVVTSAGNFPLQLSSESKTGIKIPSGQIANGGFNISAGQTKDLDIDFNTCISIVQEGNGKYRLKPVLHAGEVSTTSSSINGTVIDNATGNPVNGSVLVALEQKDQAAGIDRVFMSTLTNSSGQFVFCPLPSGTYDVVIVGESTSGTAYAPTVVTGVSTGSALSTVKLYPQPSTGIAPVTLKGTVTTQVTTSPAVATAADIELSALEQVSSTLTVTIPLLPNTTQSSATLALHTATGGPCASGLDCAGYTMVLPAATSYVGSFSASGTTLSVSVIAASYTLDAFAYLPSSGGTNDCTPSEAKSAAIAPVAGTTINVPPLAFTGCTAGY
jgi:hypothetical protein